MERFLDHVLRQLIEFPDELVILKDEAPGKTTFRLRFRPSDIGKVVGKHGTTIAAIRSLLAAAAGKHNSKAFVEIIEDERKPAPPPPVAAA
jgi:predicted RNA-binding protein YlqC (UPF0109 family)